MKNTLLKHIRFNQVLFLLLLLIPVSFTTIAQDNFPQAMTDALKAGNSIQLSRYFNVSVELALSGKEDIYSSQQAELILKDFFAKHVPSNFVILHKGGKEGSQYAIGNLSTSSGTFRVTLRVKIKDNKPFIHQLRFEEDNAG